MIAVINGSPKKSCGASQILINRMISYEPIMDSECTQLQFHDCKVTEEQLSVLSASDTWVFIFPLYADALPGHFLDCLKQIADSKIASNKKIYAVVAMGFFEGKQTRWALRIVANFCAKTGNQYCGGLGVGGTGAFDMMGKIPAFKGPMISVDTSLYMLRNNVLKGTVVEDSFTTIKFPRIAYLFAGQSAWRKTIKSNGLKSKDLGRRLKIN